MGPIDLASFKVDLDASQLQVLRYERQTASPQRGANSSEQFGRTEGLRDVIVGPGVEGLDLVFFRAMHGEHDNGHVRNRADGAASLETRKPRHIDVQEHEVVLVGVNVVERFLTALGIVNLKPFRDEGRSHDAPDLWFVVYYEDAAF